MGYRYPAPASYQVFYIGQVTTILPFAPTTEASDRAFFTPAAAQSQQWVQENRLMYEAAYKLISGS